MDRPYDYVFIDCPPSLGLLTINAFVAAREVLIPIQCEYYALEGLSQLLSNIELIEKHLNPELRLSTILLTMYDSRTNLAQQVAQEVRDHFPDQTLDTIIPRSVRVSEAPSYGQSVISYDYALERLALLPRSGGRDRPARRSEPRRTATDGNQANRSRPRYRRTHPDRRRRQPGQPTRRRVLPRRRFDPVDGDRRRRAGRGRGGAADRARRSPRAPRSRRHPAERPAAAQRVRPRRPCRARAQRPRVRRAAADRRASASRPAPASTSSSWASVAFAPPRPPASTRIPAVVKDTANEDMLRDALLENLHRSQLNPLEEASAYQQLLADFGITQEELA